MADNEFTAPDPQETSRALDALKALTTEILTLRTTMRSQSKELDKMSAQEVAARQEQISKLESLVEAQKVAIRMAEDEALTLGASGQATEDLIASVIKQTSLANRSQQLIEQELSNREALNQRLQEATKEEDRRRVRGAALQRVMASPTSLRGVAQRANTDTGAIVAENKRFSAAFEEALAKVLSQPIELLKTISSNVEMMAMKMSIEAAHAHHNAVAAPAGEGEGGGVEGVEGVEKKIEGNYGKGSPFVKALVFMAKALEKSIPGLKEFNDRVGRANQAYDKFTNSVKNAYNKVKEFFTITGFLSFALRAVGVSFFFTMQLVKDFGKKLLEISGISRAFNAVKNGLKEFGKNLMKDPIGTLKSGFMKGMQFIDKGVTKAFDGMDSFGKATVNVAKSVGSSIAAFSRSVMSLTVNVAKSVGSSIAAFSRSVISIVGTIVASISRFVLSIAIATAQIIFSAIQLGASVLTAIISFLIPVGGAILSFVGSVLMGAFTFVAGLVASAVPFLMAGLAFAGTILAAIGSFVVGVVTAVITFIGGLVAALTPIILPALIIAAILFLVIFGLYMAYLKFQAFREVVDMVIGAVKDIGMKIGGWIYDWFIQPIKVIGEKLGGWIHDYLVKPLMTAMDYIANWIPGLESSTEKEARLQDEYAVAKEEEAERLKEDSRRGKSREYLDFREKDLTKQYQQATDEEQKNRILAQITAVREAQVALPKVQPGAGAGQLTMPAGGAGGAGRTSMTVVNNAAPVVSGGGGGSPQPPSYVAPARSPNDTLRDLQGANIPRG